MTDLLAALGVLAIVSTAQLGPWMNAGLLVGLVLALAVPESWQSKALLRHLSTIGPLALFVLEIGRFVLGRSALDIAVEFAAMLQILRIATRLGAVHDQQIIVLALLHFVAGTVLGGGLAYGLCFLGFLVVAPGALVLSHLRREVEGNYKQGARDRTGLPVDVPRILRSRRVVGRQFLASTCLLSVPIFLFTAALFVLFPRVGLSLLLLNRPNTGRIVGFSDHVDLGQHGLLRADASLALRFVPDDLPEEPPPKLTLRLRGTAFDKYDSHGAWDRTLKDHSPAYHSGQDVYPIFRNPDPARDHRITFDLEPWDPPVVFLPPGAVGLRVAQQGQSLLSDPLTLYRGPEGELRYGGADARGLHYEAYLATPAETLTESLPALDRPRYLALDPLLPTRIADLARQWTEGAPTALAKARALEDHLRREYKYDMNSPSGGKPQPLDDFLFVSHRGHCEFFSTAMAVMLRTLGIPSRNVSGYVGGVFNRIGRFYAVRQADAHSWVEAYVDDAPHPTWMTFDPTPSAGAQPLEATTGFWVFARDFVEAMSMQWNRHVISYDLNQQWRLFEQLTRRYDGLRRKTGLDRGPLRKLTSGPSLVGAVLALVVAAYLLWKWKPHRRQQAKDPKAPHEETNRNMEAATTLYRALEGALALNGITRPISLPPLRHAEELRARKHPLGDEVVALTNVYIEARFGGTRLDDGAKRDFEKRIRAIRAWRRKPEARQPTAET
jgi:transglutaminase-like putative cysteine protease